MIRRLSPKLHAAYKGILSLLFYYLVVDTPLAKIINSGFNIQGYVVVFAIKGKYDFIILRILQICLKYHTELYGSVGLNINAPKTVLLYNVPEEEMLILKRTHLNFST